MNRFNAAIARHADTEDNKRVRVCGPFSSGAGKGKQRLSCAQSKTPRQLSESEMIAQIGPRLSLINFDLLSVDLWKCQHREGRMQVYPTDDRYREDVFD